MRIKRKAFIDQRQCVACGTCVNVCPLKLIHIEAGVFASINQEKCVGCSKCVRVCPASVICIKEIESEGSQVEKG